MNFKIIFCNNILCSRREFCNKAEENVDNTLELKDKSYVNFNCEEKIKTKLDTISKDKILAFKQTFENNY